MKELAQASGVSVTSIGYIERNVTSASLPTIRKLSQLLGEPIQFLGCFETMPEETLGQRITKARMYHGLLVKEAAALLSVDVKTINNWEADKKTPSPKKKTIVEKFLDILK